MRRARASWWLVVVTVVAACSAERDAGVGATSGAIVGGELVDVSTVPAMAVVGIPRPEGLEACSAVLIAPDVVLTAAHCIDPAMHGFATQEELTAELVVIFDANQVYQPGLV